MQTWDLLELGDEVRSSAVVFWYFIADDTHSQVLEPASGRDATQIDRKQPLNAERLFITPVNSHSFAHHVSEARNLVLFADVHLLEHTQVLAIGSVAVPAARDPESIRAAD